MARLEQRITINPEQCDGKPCIRGMRFRVSDVLDLLVNGLSVEEILEETPDLEREDIYASLRFASRSLDYPMVAARGIWKYKTNLPDFAELRREMDRVVEGE